MLVAHPGAEAQRWHMDTPHLFASRRAAHPARRPCGCMRSIAAAPHTPDPRHSLRLSMRLTPTTTPTRQHLPPHSVSVFIPLCALTASNGPTEFQLSTHIKANLTRPPTHADARCPLGSVAIYDIRVMHRGGAHPCHMAHPCREQAGSEAPLSAGARRSLPLAPPASIGRSGTRYWRKGALWPGHAARSPLLLPTTGANRSDADRPMVYLTFSRNWYRDVLNP